MRYMLCAVCASWSNCHLWTLKRHYTAEHLLPSCRERCATSCTTENAHGPKSLECICRSAI